VLLSAKRVQRGNETPVAERAQRDAGNILIYVGAAAFCIARPVSISRQIVRGVPPHAAATHGRCCQIVVKAGSLWLGSGYEELHDFFADHVAYAIEMNKRPQTLYGIADSPIGLAAWMLDHDPKSYQLIARAFAGNPGGLSRDDVLDNVTPGFLRLSSTGKTSSDSSSSRASRFRLGSASFRTSFTKRHAIPSDDDYGRSQSSRLSAAIRDGWARCPERMGRLFGFVDPGDIALFGTDGGRTWTRFDDTVQRP